MIERLHNLGIGLAKTFVPSFKKQSERFSKPDAWDTLVFFKIVKIRLSETLARLKESLWIMP